MENKPTQLEKEITQCLRDCTATIKEQAAEIERLKGEIAGKYKSPPFGTKRNAALALYQPPFKFYRGYVYDANNEMVSDDELVDSHIAAQVRGWGRIGYLPDAAQLQDEVGVIIAEALTAFWITPPKAEQLNSPEHKLARFGAMVLSTSMSSAASIGLDAGVLTCTDPKNELNLFDVAYAPEIEAAIKELLK